MELPDSGTLNFFNKVLVGLETLCPDGDFCAITSLLRHCRSLALGGQRADYRTVLLQCKSAGLVQIRNSRTRISSLGKRFLSANRQSYFEITDAQKQLVIERVIFKGAWNNHARALFELFKLNQSTDSYQFSKIDRSLPLDLVSLAHFFKYLGMLTETQLTLEVQVQYSQLVYELMADSKTLAELDLEKMLAENRKLGAKGERAVVEFEKNRLLKLGKIVQSELVRRISTVNVAAGYDVESFDGTSDAIVPNRFIEVKTTTGFEIRFYWTRNEIEVAKTKKKQYWIYAMVEFRENRPSDCFPIMIRNPEKEIKRHAFLTMDAHTYLIRESTGLELEEETLDEVKWFRLR